MDDTGATAHDRHVGRWVVACVVAGVAALFGFLGYTARASLEVAGLGYVVEPAGRVETSDDGPVVAYPMDRVARVRFRVPVRNTSRLTLRVRHPVEVGPPPNVAEWPATTPVNVAPGELVWLEYTYGHRCPLQALEEGGSITVGSVPVYIRATGGSERAADVPLPLPIHVPWALAPHCAPGAAP